MTTNVFDGTVGTLATDSRWSIPFGRYVAYVDDANYDKLVVYENAVFMFAGKGAVIQSWKDWIATKPQSLESRPTVDGISVCIVHLPSKKVLFQARQDITHEGALFAGTGAFAAVTCWHVNRNVTRSVESAKLEDIFTGGDVKFVAADGSNNLGTKNQMQGVMTHISMVTKAIEDRGMIMDRKTGPGLSPAAPFKLKEVAAAANDGDGELQTFKAKIANGDLSPEAPCNGMYDRWTSEQEAQLDAALVQVFGMK